MLAIRMQRNGRTHYPTYRIVVQESQRHPLSGRVVAEVGNYNPDTKKTVLDKEKIEFYLKNGAQPSSRVAFIFKKNGIKLPAWYKEAPAKQSKAKHADKLRKNQPKEEAPAEAPAEEAPATEAPAEAPAEETPAAE
ncbi:MAG: 30S ribosomal protein S16 [Candidatus Saccharibacteria bacterium]|nr:30S ribosomal protein S16 [Candidatus Saccharibacteria bacterium]